MAQPKTSVREAAEHALMLSPLAGAKSEKEQGAVIDDGDTNGIADIRSPERNDTMHTVSRSEHHSDQWDIQDGFQTLHKPRTRTLGKLKMRSQDDHDPTDWWFASTAIPLMAATFAPMANLLSIAALVVYWRNNVQYPDQPLLKYSDPSDIPLRDPRWCYILNAVSLVCGVIGNLFLLFNFTQRVRYIVALPVTIFFFYLASGILIGIIVSMHQYAPPSVNQVYSQGYWHAVIAACLYLLNSMILMINMAGYFLGHYPQHFTLTDEQRNLILQTMLFFIWLGGGAGVFARLEHWSYPDALYFCDVTILTIGFGDYFATGDVTRGLVFPFSVGGTIILGLMVNSIHKFARELSKEKVVRKHVEHRRVNTLSRAVTLDELDDTNLGLLAEGKTHHVSSPVRSDKDYAQQRIDILARQEQMKRRIGTSHSANNSDNLDAPTSSDKIDRSGAHMVSRVSSSKPSVAHALLHAVALPIKKPLTLTTHGVRKATARQHKKILMLEERDRFNAMRLVQRKASLFNRYYALTMSIIAFSMLWCLGALVFYFAEAETQQLNYFRGLYFCYVSLLTIGYGDLSPKSNAGKSFFIFWSLVAVPTMTILVSDLGDTVIGGFKRGVLQNDLGLTSSSRPAGRTAKLIHRILHPGGHVRAQQAQHDGMVPLPDEYDTNGVEPAADTGSHADKIRIPSTIDDLAKQDLSGPDLLKKLAVAIRTVAEELRSEPGKQYTYEDWVEFTRLIRFSKCYTSEGNDIQRQLEYDEITEGVVDWDWLDEKSPMTSDQTESEWILDRLCESLLRIFNRSDLLVSLLSSSDSSTVIDDQSPTTSRSPTANSPSLRKQQFRSAAPQTQSSFDAATETNSMSAVSRLLRGDVGNGSLKWSKRARTRKTASRHDFRKRRSTVQDRRFANDSMPQHSVPDGLTS